MQRINVSIEELSMTGNNGGNSHLIMSTDNRPNEQMMYYLSEQQSKEPQSRIKKITIESVKV